MSRRLAALILICAGSQLGGVSARQDKPPVVVVLTTEKGVIEIAVDVARAPATSANFLKYVDAGAYNGGRFHRTVRPNTEPNKEHPIQVIQASRAPQTPGYGAIALERTSTTGVKHLDGTISMARGGPDSATSDFFICIGNQPSLDFGGKRNADGQGFAAFGRVVSGMHVVKAIQAAPVRPSVANSANPPPLPNTQSLAPPIAITRAARK